MLATTLDLLSSGRLLLGLGCSGPQVIEGWHGVPYGRPVARSREYVALVRAMGPKNTALAAETADGEVAKCLGA